MTEFGLSETNHTCNVSGQAQLTVEMVQGTGGHCLVFFCQIIFVCINVEICCAVYRLLGRR